MAIKLNHTIVHSTNPRAAAQFFAEVFGRNAPVPFGPFLGVQVDNEVTLDFLDAEGMEIQMQHYAFLVSDAEFDQIFGRIRERGVTYWADPGRTQPGRINRHFGGRGVYFQDPSGHLLEIITRPYGSNAGSDAGSEAGSG
jgi:catechol 2,3-dioxygenase-like lactoylglutathione lyase family enzyme